MFRRWLTRLSPEPLDYQELSEIGFPEMPNALEKNSIDVAAHCRRALHRTTSDFPMAFDCLSRHLRRCLIQAGLENILRRWSKFQTAMARATQFIQDLEPQARDIIGTYTRISEPDLFMIGLPAF